MLLNKQTNYIIVKNNGIKIDITLNQFVFRDSPFGISFSIQIIFLLFLTAIQCILWICSFFVMAIINTLVNIFKLILTKVSKITADHRLSILFNTYHCTYLNVNYTYNIFFVVVDKRSVTH